VPDVNYTIGEKIEIDYAAISAQLSPEVIEVIPASSDSNDMSLSINLVSTNIIIENHVTGTIWETLKVDEFLSLNNQTLQKSPLILTYMYDGWSTGKRLDAYTHSISKQAYEIEMIDGGVRIIYHMAVHTPSLSWMLQRITSELYNTLYTATDASGRIALERIYSSPSGTNFYQIVSSIAQPFIDRIYDVWYNEYGLTIETLFELNSYFNIRNTFIEMPSFKVPVEYILDQGELVVKVVLPEIKEESVSFEEGKTLFIQDIDVLPYFFSSLNKNDAYMFVPDGSGAIIDLSLPDYNYTRYTKPVYDNRSLISSVYSTYQDQEKILMPVFGYANENRAIFAIIESGAMQSLMQVRRSSSANNLNAIHPTIIYRYKDIYSLSGIDIDMYSNPMNDTSYQIRYQMIEHEDDDVHYMDMVEKYQQYLFEDKIRQAVGPAIKIEMLGAILDRAFFVGIPYDQMISLTSYRDVIDIMDS
ncbi:MAG: DUF5696 domain-containing protein, partial [Acholeplasmataceae bacterium]|nr:DUF5696 domain-containing protein [Acholeplasmataceae bacterium]